MYMKEKATKWGLIFLSWPMQRAPLSTFCCTKRSQQQHDHTKSWCHFWGKTCWSLAIQYHSNFYKGFPALVQAEILCQWYWVSRETYRSSHSRRRIKGHQGHFVCLLAQGWPLLRLLLFALDVSMCYMYILCLLGRSGPLFFHSSGS